MTVAGAVAGVGLALAGFLHCVWVFSTWPLSSRDEYARVVVGVEDETRAPSAPLTLTVALLLLTASYLVAARSDLMPSGGPAWITDVGAWVIAVVLLIRGIGGLVVSGFGLGEMPPEFARWNLRIYSPLCLVLGVLATACALG
ncbi:Protein of unknown function (DUF3995) [Parafrankia irregularis]|uniref:DUF3995 domain-containing protein n=1 Tax=Parafrankia irregularis TaxID=795642 RepID=A0A0S4QY62_9ACTN|nr:MULTISPECIES: DUF3995 domain-containing protein [Parafrankia]MBE3203639.1 DUF3995 domain-containing protein [Parafrankia sp. CH37]CUU60576.1 Protein of unknown function (DUF3995) [Parafrankia irregularis]